MQTCQELAVERLSQRSIKPSTIKEYLGTLRTLGIEDLPVEAATVAALNARLQTVLRASTRRKHAINLRAALGVPVYCPRAEPSPPAIPRTAAIRSCLETSPYRLWGLVMLYAGLRLGEACANQPLSGTTLSVDRQRLPSGELASSKTSGPVVIPGWLAAEYAEHDFDRSANTVYVGIRRAGSRAGLELRPHLLRHAFATSIVAAGGHPEMLRRQMRHRDVSVSLAYYIHVSDRDLQALAESL